MAGRPRRQAMIAELERLTREFFEDDPIPDHLAYVECLVAAGSSIQATAESLSLTLQFTVDRETLRRYLYSLDANHAAERLARAREEGAHAAAEESRSIADTVDEDGGAVAKARLRVSTRQFLAERWNPAAFGQSKGVNVSISVGSLHLQALQAAPKGVTGSIQAAPNNTEALNAPNAEVIAITSVSVAE